VKTRKKCCKKEVQDLVRFLDLARCELVRFDVRSSLHVGWAIETALRMFALKRRGLNKRQIIQRKLPRLYADLYKHFRKKRGEK
jgi:hypothetical protein